MTGRATPRVHREQVGSETASGPGGAMVRVWQRGKSLPSEPHCPAMKLCKGTSENLRAGPKSIMDTNTGEGNHGF